MTRLLITGAGGFIGRHVVQALSGRPGLQLVLMSRDTATLTGLPGLHVTHNIASMEATGLREKLGNPDAVLHLAWSDLGAFKNPSHVTDILPAHTHFLLTLLEQGITDLTVTGTCFEYGLQGGQLTETTPATPSTFYGLAKDTLHKALQLQQAKSQNFNLKWLRLFYMYGPGQAPKTILAQLDAALARDDESFNMSGGEQLRDYLPVEKLAANIVAATLQNNVTGTINIGSGAPISIRQLVENHVTRSGKSIKLNLGFYPYPDYEPMQFWADTTKFNSVFLTQS